MNNKIENEKKMKEFMKEKENEQNELERIYRETKLEEELKAKRKFQKRGWEFSNEKVVSMIPPQKLEEYNKAFAAIAKSTNVKDIDELVANFIDAEERNFILSKFVKELTEESETLDTQIDSVKKEIEMYKNQGLGQDNERKKMQK